MDSPSNSTTKIAITKTLYTLTKSDVLETLNVVKKNIGPTIISDKGRLIECVLKLWSKLKKIRMIINGRAERETYALKWYDPKAIDKGCKIYYNMVGHPMYQTELSIAEFLICGIFNSSNSIVNNYYSDAKMFSKLEGFTCEVSLVCNEEECITSVENKSCVLYHKEMKVDGLENIHDSNSVECKFGDTQPIKDIFALINQSKMLMILTVLEERRKAIQSGNYMKTNVTDKSLSIIGTSFITIDRAILEMVKYIYLCCPNECEAYRLNKGTSTPIDEDDIMIKHWRNTVLKNTETVMNNCQSMLTCSCGAVPISDYIFALLVDTLCVMSVGTFI